MARILLALVLSCWAAGSEGCWSPEVPAPARIALEAAERADQFDLLSLDPFAYAPERFPLGDQPKEGFHGQKILGKVTLSNVAVRKKLVSALGRGIAESRTGEEAKCFDPRHGIHSVGRDGRGSDFVICFECGYVKIFEGDKEETFLTTGSPQLEFDRVLRQAGIPLAERHRK